MKKGKNKKCNINTCCNNKAIYLSKVTLKYYCKECALKINCNSLLVNYGLTCIDESLFYIVFYEKKYYTLHKVNENGYTHLITENGKKYSKTPHINKLMIIKPISKEKTMEEKTMEEKIIYVITDNNHYFSLIYNRWFETIQTHCFIEKLETVQEVLKLLKDSKFCCEIEEWKISKVKNLS